MRFSELIAPFFLEGSSLRSRPAESLTPLEREIIAEIRSMRSAPKSEFIALLLDSPAKLVNHFILASHGNVQLRFSAIASELGVEVRSLERAFADEYHVTMTQRQTRVRLDYSQWLLNIYPPHKISTVATILGYRLVQDFNRFFKKHMRIGLPDLLHQFDC
jgi:transcriptional regulator GlxA family with amidase domain